ncbi:MAG: glycogen/starch synthase [Bacteroidales bacterium]|jgi:starch synthase|nr:glycogen/starch synthase [Bacteroidales bacterium]
MEKARVLFVEQAIMPYLKETPMSRIGRYLPQGIQEKGKEIRTFMPRFGNINERRNQLHEVIRLSGMNLIINDTDHPLIIKVASIQQARMQIYFIDNEDFFHRKFTIRDKANKFYKDNDERSIFFSRGVLETVKKLGWAPDVVHCHGWISALVPLYVKRAYKDNPLFSESKVIYSVYDDSFSEDFQDGFDKKIRLPGITAKDLKYYKKPNYVTITKAALDYADAIIMGSEKVHPEIDEYIQTLKKPILEYQTEDNYIEAYNAFYDTLLGK